VLPELNKKSLLLLYLAGELPAEEREQVDRMQATDATLRAELEKLSGAVDSFESGMALLDARPVPAESLMVRRIGSAMRRHIADRLVEAEPAPARRNWNASRWAWPAAAAAILVVSLGYWGMQPDGRVKNPAINNGIVKVPRVPGNPVTPTPEAAVASDDLDEAETHTDLQWYRGSQHQLAELARSQDVGADTIFGLNDSNE
jgi:anti-sigma factor RsiW